MNQPAYSVSDIIDILDRCRKSKSTGAIVDLDLSSIAADDLPRTDRISKVLSFIRLWAIQSATCANTHVHTFAGWYLSETDNKVGSAREDRIERCTEALVGSFRACGIAVISDSETLIGSDDARRIVENSYLSALESKPIPPQLLIVASNNGSFPSFRKIRSINSIEYYRITCCDDFNHSDEVISINKSEESIRRKIADEIENGNLQRSSDGSYFDPETGLHFPPKIKVTYADWRKGKKLDERNPFDFLKENFSEYIRTRSLYSGMIRHVDKSLYTSMNDRCKSEHRTLSEVLSAIGVVTQPDLCSINVASPRGHRLVKEYVSKSERQKSIRSEAA